MQNVLFFLFRYKAFFLFLVLEIVAFYFLVTFNTSQRAIFNTSMGDVRGWFYQVENKATQFVNLEATANNLARENAIIFEKLEQSKYHNLLEKDSSITPNLQQQYTYSAARVVNNSTTLQNNYITLNRGSQHGIKPNTGVIDGKGIVGIVVNTSPKFSVAMSLYHSQMRLSGMIKRNREFGSLVWKGGDTRFMILEDVSTRVQVMKGDTIQTSGFSSIFPSGLMVGTVEDYWAEMGSNFYQIRVKLSNNISQLEYAYIVTNIMQNEQLKLEQTVKNE